MSGHIAVGIFLFVLSISIIIIYVSASLVPSVLASILGTTAERLQFALVFIPVALAMVGVSIGIAYVGYSILREAQEREGSEKEAKR